MHSKPPQHSPNNRPPPSSSSSSSMNLPNTTPARSGTGIGIGGVSPMSRLKQFEGVVLEVVSGDTFLVLEDDKNSHSNSNSGSGSGDKDSNNNNNSSSLVATSSSPQPSSISQTSMERRVTLSSIRAPRVGNSKVRKLPTLFIY